MAYRVVATGTSQPSGGRFRYVEPMGERELEVQAYRATPGAGIGGALERGAGRIGQSFNAAAANLGFAFDDAVGEYLPQGLRDTLKTDAQRTLQRVQDTEQELSRIPQHPSLTRAVQAANEADGVLPAIGAFGREIAESPDKLGLLSSFAAEQVPNLATQAAISVGTRGLGAVPALGIGAGGASAASTFGPNVAEGQARGLTPQEAFDRAQTQTLAQGAVDAATGAVVPLRIGRSQLTNIPAQAGLQAAGGAGGEAARSLSVGETPEKGELILEGAAELLGLPADVATAGLARRGRREAQAAEVEPEQRQQPILALPAPAEPRQPRYRVISSGETINLPDQRGQQQERQQDAEEILPTGRTPAGIRQGARAAGGGEIRGTGQPGTVPGTRPGAPSVPALGAQDVRGDGQRVTSRISTPAGREIDVEERIVDARELVTSQNDEGQIDARFPAELQPRDRGRLASRAQIEDIARNIRPDELIVSAKATDGAPIVSDDGIVESGNGRTLALRQAYRSGQAGGYRNRLQELGYNVEGVEQPVLVRVRRTPLQPEDRAAFTREANERDTLALSATERALADAQAIPDGLLEMYQGGDVQQAGNRRFVSGFADAVVSPTDRAAFIRPDGTLSQEGIRRVQGAVLARAYEDADIVGSMVEDTDSNVRSIGGALLDVSPKWARMRERARDGQVEPALDITPNLIEAAGLVRKARNDRTSLAELVNQQDIFSGQTDPVTVAALQLMFYNRDNLTRPVSRQRIAEALDLYASQALESSPAETQLFSDIPQATSGDILGLARRRVIDEQGASAQSGFDFAEAGSGQTGASVSASGAETQRPSDDTQSAAGATGTLYANPFDPELVRRLLTGPAFNWTREQTQRFINARRRMLEEMGATGGDDRPPFRQRARTAAQGLLDFHNLVLASNDGFLRTLASRHNSPAIENIRRMLWSDAGQDAAVGQTFEEGVNQYAVSMVNRLARALKPLGTDQDTLQRVARLVQNREQIRPSGILHKAATEISKLLDENRNYLQEAGIEIGDVEGYFPRVPDTNAIASDPEGFVKRAVQVYEKDFAGEMTPEEMRERAERWRDNVLLAAQGIQGDGATFGRDFGVMPVPSSLKSRTLSKAADEIMRPYMMQNPADALATFFYRSARRAEWERRFGGGKWADLRQGMIDDGVHGDDIAEVEKAIESATGVMPSRLSPKWRRRLSKARQWSAFTFLTRATFASLGEPALAAMRSGKVSNSYRSYANTFKALLKRSSVQEQREILEDVLGMAGSLAEDMAMHQRFSDYDLDSKEIRYKNSRFYRLIGLSQWTEASKVGALSVGQEFVRQISKDIARRGNKHKSAQFLAAELGVSRQKADQFAEWVLSQSDGTPGRDTLLEGTRGNDDMAKMYNLALQRFVDQTVMQPKRAERPRFASHPIGSFFYSLQGYINSFSKNVLLRNAKQLREATKRGKGYTVQDRLAFAAPALMMPLYLGLAAGVSELRDEVYKNPTAKEKTAGQNIGTYWSRAGYFGNYDPVVNLIMGLRYQRDPATTLAGPLGGSASELFSSAVRYFTQNSPNTNASERKLAKDFYNVVLQPMIVAGIVKNVPGGIAPALGIQAISHPQTREAFIEAVAGKKQARRGRASVAVAP